MKKNSLFEKQNLFPVSFSRHTLSQQKSIKRNCVWFVSWQKNISNVSTRPSWTILYTNSSPILLCHLMLCFYIYIPFERYVHFFFCFSTSMTKKKEKQKCFFFLNVIQFVCVIVWICRERWEICTCRVCVCVRWPLGCFYHFRSTKSHLCKQKKNVVLILLMIWRWCYGTYITSFSSPYVCVLFPPLIIYLRHQPNPKKHHNIVLCNSLVILSLSPFVHWFSIRPPIKSPSPSLCWMT
jgi:hypothetical protein